MSSILLVTTALYVLYINEGACSHSALIVILEFLINLPVFCEFGFIEEPTNQNVSEGSSVVFNCTAYSKGYYWTVDGKFIDDEYNENRELSKQDEIINDITDLKIHLLTVPATITNDGITVECFIYSSITIGSAIVESYRFKVRVTHIVIIILFTIIIILPSLSLIIIYFLQVCWMLFQI